jgi:hypothetical protein
MASLIVLTLEGDPISVMTWSQTSASSPTSGSHASSPTGQRRRVRDEGLNELAARLPVASTEP